jgi:hypothetical protein
MSGQRNAIFPESVTQGFRKSVAGYFVEWRMTYFCRIEPERGAHRGKNGNRTSANPDKAPGNQMRFTVDGIYRIDHKIGIAENRIEKIRCFRGVTP